MKSQEELNVFRAFISYRLLNNKFPPFQMLSVDGDSINNRSFSNGVTVLNFWYYGCYGCILELPALNQLCNSFSKDSEINFFSFFNDSVIRKKDSLFFSTRIMSSKVNGRSKPQYSDACYNQLSDTKKFSDQIPIFEYPTNMIVDCDGIVRFIIVGGWRDSTAWIEMIKDKIREQTRICNKGKMN